MLVVAAGSARATLFTYDWGSGFNNGGVIPDGNASGWSDTRTISGIFDPSPNPQHTDEIVDVNVRVNISGGYNGDLYGYLVHSSGFSVLLNRVGRTSTDAFGYSDAGMNITLNDQATETTDIHLYQTVGGYNIGSGTQWRPDGRTDNPNSVTESTANRNALLENFNTLSANGTWTLFLADLATGDTSTLVSWGLDISVVPEPITWALIVFGGALGLARGRHLWRARRSR